MQTPIFVFSPEKLKENFKDFKLKCESVLSKVKIAYSVKTNPFEGIIKVLEEAGSGFEVASIDEIEKVKGEFIVFNGACKTEEELEKAIKRKFLINIDSKSELDRIANILGKSKKKLEIGLRVSIRESKFGFDGSKIKEAISYANSKNMKVVCLSFHPGTQINLREYEREMQEFSEIVEDLGLKLKCIDVGGGIPDKFQLKNLGLRVEDYLGIIKKYFAKYDTTIILEPGRTLVADTMHILTKVCVIKENFGKKFAVLDAGINILPKITLASYRFVKEGVRDKEAEGKKEEYILAGPLLFSNDILGKFYGSLKEGDIIKVENVGAYCYSLAWELSYKKPKIAMEFR